jgi:hypothetical protein
VALLRLIRIGVTGVALLLTHALAEAQSLRIVRPVRAGECSVVVEVLTPLSAMQSVQIRVVRHTPPSKTPGKDAQFVAFGFSNPIKLDDTITARVVGPGDEEPKAQDSYTVDTEAEAVQCHPDDPSTSDEREGFEATAYLGRVYDNFAPAIVGNYAKTAPKNQNNRAIYGVDFGGRLWSSANTKRQFWLFGETLHGVRSTDVDCRVDASKQPPVCTLFANPLNQPAAPVEQALFIVEQASSFEGFVQPRFEFLTLKASGSHRAVLYGTAVFGFIMLDDASDRAAAAHHFGGGLAFTAGAFSGTYIEAGWGKTDLFIPAIDNGLDQPYGPDLNEAGSPQQTGTWNRLKIDAYLTLPIGRMFPATILKSKKMPRIFIQAFCDFDPRGNDADSVQTFLGVELDVAEFFK